MQAPNFSSNFKSNLFLLFLLPLTLFFTTFVSAANPKALYSLENQSLTLSSLSPNIFLGTYDFSADVYYELKSNGFYSPKVFEGYVHQPNFQVTAAAELRLDLQLFSLFQVKTIN